MCDAEGFMALNIGRNPSAESRTSARLKNRDVYPSELIRAVGQAIYRDGDPPDLRKAMGMVFWSCLHNDAWKRP
jgi:hypothetical protein